ncbi:hypothetical protein INR49_016190, partial [Caranx melampygus]
PLENVPVELREPLYKDQYEQEHLKPAISKLLLSPEIYCRAQALLAQGHAVSAPASQASPADNSALLQFLIKKGFAPKVQDVDVTEEDLTNVPIKTKSHLALMDALMSLAAKETVGRVKMAAEAEQMGVGSPWENALLFWVNRLNQKLRESTEEEEPAVKPPTCTDMQPVQESDTMSVADSLYNLQLIKEFCESSLHSCCPLAVEDLLYAPPVLHLNIMSFIAELLDWFEVKKPILCSPYSPSTSQMSQGYWTVQVLGSPSFIFKQPFVPISSPVSPVTFSIPFGLDSDVDIVMGNPIDSVFRSVSTDSLTTGIPAMTSPVTSAGMSRVPYSPPEDLSHLVSASAPSQRSSWGPYAHTAPLAELPTIEEALQVVHTPNSKDRKKGRTPEKSGRGVLGGRPEPRLRPEGAPAGFFLHSPEEDNPPLSSSAPCRSGVLYRPVGGEGGDTERQGGERGRRDDAPRNAPGNIRPSNNRQGNHSTSSSPRMTSFAERRDNRRRHPAAPGEESASAATPTTPGTPNTPSTPAGAHGRQDSPGPRGPEPGSEAWELGARLEEKRKSIEAQKDALKPSLRNTDRDLEKLLSFN